MFGLLFIIISISSNVQLGSGRNVVPSSSYFDQMLFFSSFFLSKTKELGFNSMGMSL